MEETKISFVAPGEPKSQPRPRVGKYGVYYPLSKKIEAYRKAILDSFNAAALEAGLPGRLTTDPEVVVVVSTIFVFSRPRRLLTRAAPKGWIPKLTTPDVDNLMKNVLDALKGASWVDDNQVWLEHVGKIYAKTETGGASGKKMVSGLPLTYIALSYHEDHQGASLWSSAAMRDLSSFSICQKNGQETLL